MSLYRRRLCSLLVLFAAGAAWGQEIRYSPVVAPVVPVVAGAAAMAPVTTPILPAAGTSLALPAVAVRVPVVQARSLASPSQAASWSPVAARELASPAGSVARAGAVAQAVVARDVSVVARAAALLQESPSVARLAEFGSPIEGTGLAARSSRLSSFYDRSRSPPATPVASPVQAAPPRQPGDNGGLTGRALLEEVHRSAQRGHNAQDYKSAKGHMYQVVDHVQRGNQGGILEAYTQTFVPGSSANGGDYRGSDGGEHDSQGINAEHVWPQSFFAKKLPMRSDLHNLLPTFVHPNGLRGHLPFGEVTGRPEYSNRAGAKLGGGVFEPPPAVKGRVARAVLYFVARYRDDAVRQGEYSENFFNQRLEMYLRWNREHPPTDEERSRNDRIEKFQGNRNPFIDDPSLAERIGVEGFRFDSGRNKARGLRPLSVKPYFNPQALIETAGMKPHRQLLRESRPLRTDPTASYGGRKRSKK